MKLTTKTYQTSNYKGRTTGLILRKLMTATTNAIVISILLFNSNVYSQSGDWDNITTAGTVSWTDHGNGVIQLVDNNASGCVGAAVHETTDTYDPTTDGVFNKCYQVYFGCPGQDEIGSDSKGDGLAFSFSKCAYNSNSGYGCGGGLGYAGACPQMVTVEFDTYASVGDPNVDPNYEGTGNNDQVAIHVNGDAAIAGKLAGADPGNLEDGLEHQVCINYDPSTDVMTVSIDGNNVLVYDFTGSGYEFGTYFGAGGLNQSWSTGKFGATNPATVSDANENDISDNVGGPLCPSSSVITSHENGDIESQCGGSIQITSFASPPAGNTVDYVEFYINGGSIGVGTVDPSNSDLWNIDWTPPGNATYQFRADAHYTPSGTQTNSYDVSVTVTGGSPPTVVANSNDGDNTICLGESITLTGSGTAASYTWDNGVTDGVSFSPTTTTTYTVTGNSAGCTATDDITITVNPIPTVTASGATTICDGQSTNLTASGATSYSWDNGAGTGSPVSVSPSTTTTYTVTGTSSGCSSTDDVTVTVNPNPTVTASGATTICDGQSTNLTASGAASYSWDNGAGTGSPVSVSPSTTTTYTVTGTTSGCSSTDDVTVTVNPNPTVTASGATTICDGQSTNLTASGATSYSWDNGAGSGSLVSVSPSTTTTYTVTGTTSGCSSTDNVTITVNPIPTVTASGAATICNGESTNLTASGATSYTWDNGAGTGSPVSVSPSTTTTYTVTGTTSGCSSTDDVTVTVNDLPTATVSGDATICDDGSTTNLTINFTGSGPFDIDVLEDGGAFSTETGVSNPHTVAVSNAASYTIANVSDANCTGTSATGNVTIEHHDDVVATPSLECNDVNASLGATEYQIRVTVTQGDLASINITELTSVGIVFTDQGGGVWLSNAIDETNTVDINVTDVNDCNGGIDLTGLQTQCSCPASGSIALTGADPICPGGSSSLDVTFGTTIGTGPFNVTVVHPTSGAVTTNSVTSPFPVTISELGSYTATIEDVGNGCTVSATGSVSLSEHTLPTATVSGDATICNDGSTTNLTINFTGSGPFDIDVLEDGGAFSTETGVSNPHTVAVSNAASYTIANVSDANCPGTSATGNVTIGLHDNVIATPSLECSDVNASLGATEYQIRVTVTQGDLALINITELTSVGVVFTDQGGGVWLSNAIDETNTVDINVTDVNDCNGGIDLTGLQTQCSCPASGSIALTGADPICPGGSSSLDVTFGTTIGTGPFNVTVVHPTSGAVTTNSVTSPFPVTISELGSYTATIEDVGNGCTVSATGSVSLSEHTLPTATVSGDATICNDGSTTNLTINFTGSGPFDIDVLEDGGAFSTETGVSNPHTVAVSNAASYTIANVSDANCPGTSATGNVTIAHHDEVLATAITECSDINPALAANEFQIRVTVTQGDLASINITEITAVGGITFTDQGGGEWVSSPIVETNSVDINVTDANNCNGGVDITALQTQCTCPTSASIAITGANPICPGDNTTLEVTFSGGTGPFDVTVTGPSGALPTEVSATSPTQFTIADQGSYSAVVMNNGEVCSVNTTSIDLNHLTPVTPDVSIALDNDPSCLGDNITFTATESNGGGSPMFEWYVDNTINGSPTASSTFTTNSLLDGQVIRVEMTSSETCTTTGTAISNNITVDIVNPPNPSLSTPSPICEGSTTTITATVLPGSTITWLLDGVPQSNTTTTQTISSLNDEGDWSVIEDNGVCPAVTSGTVTTVVDEMPIVVAGETTTIFVGQSTTLNGYVSSGIITWTPDADLTNETTATPTFTPSVGGNVLFEITAVDGMCTASDQVSITVREPIKIPNAFSPNADGSNDVWEIAGLQSYESATLEVFNRWGSPVYKSVGVVDWWTGYKNGKAMPVATYYYILTLSTDDEPITGSVTLVR